MISEDEILSGNDPEDIPKEHLKNIKILLEKMNRIRFLYGKAMVVTSGYRSIEHNKSIPNASKNSAHCIGKACDIRDKDGDIMRFVLKNLGEMKDLGIYIEDFRWTRSPTKGCWVHFGTRRPDSGKRIFIPSSAPPEDRDCWDGKYDVKFDG